MFGISSFCLIKEPLTVALDRLSAVSGLREIVDEGPHFIRDPAELESYSADFVIHAPYHGMNIACVFDAIRKASVKVITECFAVAAEASADVVIHPGYFAWEQEHEKANRQFKASLHKLNAAADDPSVTFYFENMGDMNYFNLRTPGDLDLIENAGFALDVEYAHLNHCLPGFLDAKISHMHLHDNDGTRDTHSPVGRGTIDFSGVLEALQRNHATSVIEVGTFEGVLESLKSLDSPMTGKNPDSFNR